MNGILFVQPILVSKKVARGVRLVIGSIAGSMKSKAGFTITIMIYGSGGPIDLNIL